MHRLNPDQALEAGRTAVRSDRLRVSHRAEAQLEADERAATHVDRAVQTATHAEPMPEPECWTLSGGTDLDGQPLVIEIEITDRFVRVLSVREER